VPLAVVAVAGLGFCDPLELRAIQAREHSSGLREVVFARRGFVVPVGRVVVPEPCHLRLLAGVGLAGDATGDAGTGHAATAFAEHASQRSVRESISVRSSQPPMQSSMMRGAPPKGAAALFPPAPLGAGWGEASTPARREHRELSADELERLLGIASGFAYFPLIRTAVYTGLRLGELLGLTWADVDFDRAELHVHRQWSKGGGFAEPKTPSAVRRVVLAPDLAQFLREHKARSAFSTETDFVFASMRRTALGHRNVCRAFTEITKRAGLGGEPRFTFHSLRAVYAALTIDRGITSTVLASQMGHADSGVTERKYIHLFNRVRTDEAVRAAMQSAMGLNGKFVASTGGNEREPERAQEGAQVAFLHERVPVASR
jgi:integrase